MAEFNYQCPHCGEATTVGFESLGKTSLCNACARPYLPEVPLAKLITAPGEPGFSPAGEHATTPTQSPSEQTVLTVNPAAFREVPVRSLVLALITLAGLIGLFTFTGEAAQGIGYAALTAISALAVVISAAMLTTQFVLSRFESLTITNQRTVWARGVINRRSSEVQHDDIRNIQVQQSLVERLVGAGTIAISSAGQDDMEIVARGIARPRRVIETIRTHQRRLVKGD